MTENLKSALCGKCLVPLQGDASNGAPDRFECPSCGRSDTREVVTQEVARFARDKAAEHLNAGLRRAAAGSRFLKVERQFSVSADHKYVVELDFN